MQNEDASIKEAARRIIDRLPDSATWEDLIERIRVWRSIEAGLKDVEEGHEQSVEELRRSFGLPE